MICLIRQQLQNLFSKKLKTTFLYIFIATIASLETEALGVVQPRAF